MMLRLILAMNMSASGTPGQCRCVAQHYVDTAVDAVEPDILDGIGVGRRIYLYAGGGAAPRMAASIDSIPVPVPMSITRFP